ncbi:unnamed protein product [Arabis nemorensis]|uniref:CCHC-type domain-containing protein n=1 Tax=Arabis nemorensis TaxID=586526 RepID=A0A565BU81_9BRAS|nr:unnamed protein product [Arabis nemorensis]
MLNSGTKELDKILTVGRTEKTCSGLGYQGYTFQDKTTFVSSGILQDENHILKTKSDQIKSSQERTQQTNTGCFYCGKYGHYKAHLSNLHPNKYRLFLLNRISQLWRQKKFTWNGWRNQVWMKKRDLYGRSYSQEKEEEEISDHVTLRREDDGDNRWKKTNLILRKFLHLLKSRLKEAKELRVFGYTDISVSIKMESRALENLKEKDAPKVIRRLSIKIRRDKEITGQR